jgi:hypothetical protein
MTATTKSNVTPINAIPISNQGNPVSVNPVPAPVGVAPREGLSLVHAIAPALAPTHAPVYAATPIIVGRKPTRQEFRIQQEAQEQALEIHAQSYKVRTALHEFAFTNQQAAINTAQTFSFIVAMRGLSTDPEYQAWWSSWSRYQAERFANTTDELLALGAATLAQIVASPVEPPGVVTALWNRLFGG